ncbi:MAG: hypothetical protein HKN44_10180 [Ilumatobacter sp.]|nr:hypothetical protein [Ilumatobacter sp.]
MSNRFIVGAVAAIALSTVAAGPAGADPDNRNSFGPIEIDCGSGTFDVVAHGNGQFASAQVIGTNQVLVPLAFKDATFTYTDPSGTPFPEPEPDATKGSGKQQGVWCTYSFDIDTGNGLENLSGSGDVYAKITPGT